MIIAGEASGDMHGAKLAQSIKNRSRDTFLFGVGGNAMQTEGVQLIVDSKTLSVVGITEVFAKLPTIYRAMTTVKKALNSLKPDLLILIDFPDFNFHVAAVAKKLDIPVLYYISPQIWAWRQNRVKKIKRLVNHMAVILPFEVPFYREHHVPVTFVGHPLLDRILPLPGRQPSSTLSTEPVIGLIPGSREKEVTTLLPVMLEAAKIIKRYLPTARFVVSCAESINEDLVLSVVSQYASTLEIEIIRESVVQVFKQSQLLVAASGTVTLEAALYGVPMVIVYKVSPLSYWLGKRLIKVKHIGIVNLIVQKELLPELIQDNASPQIIAETVTDMINDPERLKQIKEELFRVRDLLGGAGASDRVARIALDLI
ncbi:MAG: lipid-A-disaccharide synthase [Desulfosarcina sp.]|nr:lipid-A-disaccharide synthase [Desulfosarcina sp.]MBC2765085.1 lipid-A-disaccharide synthase [Desulfosarcina sp.]